MDERTAIEGDYGYGGFARHSRVSAVEHERSWKAPREGWMEQMY